MRVLVAGDRGCVGNALAPLLRAAGHEAGGWYLGRDEGCDLRPADLAPSWTVPEGIYELTTADTKYGLSCNDFTSARFVRLRRIRELLAAGMLNDMLYRQPDDQQLTAGAGTETAGPLGP